MTTDRLLIHAAIATFLFMGSGCQKATDEPKGEDITFENVTTKAGNTTVDADGELQQAPFGIFGYKYESDGSGISQVFESSSAQKVEYGKSGWTYSPKRKWEAKLYIFRALWPYDAKVNSGSDAMRLAIDYSTARDNHNLMVSFSTRDRVYEGIAPVKMEFRHTLAALKFEIKFKEGEETDNLTRFYLKGIYPVGTMFYGNEKDSFEEGDMFWKTNMFDSSSENLLWEGSKPFSATETATVYDGDGLMFIIPQTLSSSDDRTTSLNFYTEKAGDALHAYDFPKTTLEPGKIYTYTISLAKSNIQISVDIEDWNTIQSNTDINL